MKVRKAKKPKDWIAAFRALEREIVVDGFAGGGGVAEGFKEALGFSPDIGINHDAVAIAMHKANHPTCIHINSSIFKVVPEDVLHGKPVGALWISPDCKHFSKAKGAKPVEKNIRALATVALVWARLPEWQRPRIIFLENVEEFVKWGPLLASGRPDPEREGEDFRRFVKALKRHGYKRVEWCIDRCSNHGDPTIRRRLILIARCDGEPIVWPAHTHGSPELPEVLSGDKLPWLTAADHVIDWSIPCPSIFLSRREVKQLWRDHGIRVQRPLRPNTLARIFKGLQRYVFECADPFIIPVTHSGDHRSHSSREPVRTQTGARRGEHALIMPYLAPRYKEKNGHDPRTRSVKLPMATAMPRGNEGVLVVPYLAGVGGRASQSPPKTASAAINTQTAKPDQVVVTPYITKFNRGATGHSLKEPLHTVTAHTAKNKRRNGGASTLGVVTPILLPTGARRDGKTVISLPEMMAEIGELGAGAAPAVDRSRRVAAFLAQHNYMEPGHDAREPVSTIVGKGCTQAVVSAGLINLKGTKRRSATIKGPTPAITAQGGHLAEVRAFLLKYYGTRGGHQDARDPLHSLTAKARFGIVTIHGDEYQIVDIGMRMLTARERFNAHSFPATYKIDIMVPRQIKGRTVLRRITGEEQGRMVGNSVPVKFAAAHIKANFRPRQAIERRPPRASEEFQLVAAE